MSCIMVDSKGAQEYDPLMTSTTCAVGPCTDGRAPDSLYCRRHGPTEKAQARLDKARPVKSARQRTPFPWAASFTGIALVVWVGLFFMIDWLENILIAVIVAVIVVMIRRDGAKSDAEAKRAAAMRAGAPALVCPHCQTAGQVTANRVTKKVGVDGAKLGRALHGSPEGALGGMAKKELVTELSCGNCGMTWDVA